MASCFRNICAKNRQNPLIFFKVTIDNVGVPFLRHSVHVYNYNGLSMCVIKFTASSFVDEQDIGHVDRYLQYIRDWVGHSMLMRYNVLTKCQKVITEIFIDAEKIYLLGKQKLNDFFTARC